MATLVTGALGCIGAWTVKTLVDEGETVVTFDKGGDARRLRLLLGPEMPPQVTMVEGDITDGEALGHALDDHGIDRIIHLAALQVPFVRAEPVLGAMVNVVGTMNVFEQVKARPERMGPIVYAGSVGMFSATDADPSDGRLHENAVAHPSSHYGVFKRANEDNASVYARDDDIASVGLRPMVIYGPGRDQGMTSDPSRAVLSAVLGREFEIGFGGRMLFQFAPDAARAFVMASQAPVDGAKVYNLNGTLASIDAFVETLDDVVPGAAGLIRHRDALLDFPEDVESTSLAELGDVPVTPLREAIAATVDLFGRRLAAGQLDPAEHGLRVG